LGGLREVTSGIKYRAAKPLYTVYRTIRTVANGNSWEGDD